MNLKTYCPLGKINCERFIHTTESGWIRCASNINDRFCSTYLMEPRFQICPIPNSQIKTERYDLCEDQAAQINCHRDTCIWNSGQINQYSGWCKNISPAIVLNWSKATYCPWQCYSFKEKL